MGLKQTSLVGGGIGFGISILVLVFEKSMPTIPKELIGLMYGVGFGLIFACILAWVSQPRKSEMDYMQTLSAAFEITLRHGHLDVNALYDDIKHGRPVAGPCSWCGIPRFQRGKDIVIQENKHD